MKAWGRSHPKVEMLSASSEHHADGCAVCCIYHKPRPIDESSDESESSSSDDESDTGGEDGGAKPSKENNGKPHRHDHKHQHGCDGDKSIPKGAKRPPNAYEHVPRTT